MAAMESSNVELRNKGKDKAMNGSNGRKEGEASNWLRPDPSQLPTIESSLNRSFKFGPAVANDCNGVQGWMLHHQISNVAKGQGMMMGCAAFIPAPAASNLPRPGRHCCCKGKGGGAQGEKREKAAARKRPERGKC